MFSSCFGGPLFFSDLLFRVLPESRHDVEQLGIVEEQFLGSGHAVHDYDKLHAPDLLIVEYGRDFLHNLHIDPTVSRFGQRPLVVDQGGNVGSRNVFDIIVELDVAFVSDVFRETKRRTG
jgi:hypothetical protein